MLWGCCDVAVEGLGMEAVDTHSGLQWAIRSNHSQ